MRQTIEELLTRIPWATLEGRARADDFFDAMKRKSGGRFRAALVAHQDSTYPASHAAVSVLALLARDAPGSPIGVKPRTSRGPSRCGRVPLASARCPTSRDGRIPLRARCCSASRGRCCSDPDGDLGVRRNVKGGVKSEKVLRLGVKRAKGYAYQLDGARVVRTRVR